MVAPVSSETGASLPIGSAVFIVVSSSAAPLGVLSVGVSDGPAVEASDFSSSA
jgi:hypothetical protein